MVYCTYCGQSFTRDEHLERHILTHTNVKPFKCFTCHMSFARRDLLQRHYTVHGKDQNQEIIPAANGMIPKSAGRTPIACSNCAKTKTKCDKKFPCSRCSARNLRCTLRPTRRNTKGTPRIDVSANGGFPAPPPGHTISVETAVEPNSEPQQGKSPPLEQQYQHRHHQRPALKPASPKNRDTNGPEKTRAELVGTDSPSRLQEMSNSGPTTTMPDAISSQVQTPAGGFARHTYSDFDAFQGMVVEDTDPSSSPNFMLDWSQMQMPLGFDGLVEPQFLMHNSTDTGFDPSMFSLPQPTAPATDGMLSIMPNVANAMPPPLITPEETPRVERTFSEMDIGSSATAFKPRQRGSSASTRDEQDEMTQIIAARDAWPAFRCTPILPSGECPKTAKLNLECLEQTLKNGSAWTTWTPKWDETDFAGADHLTVMQLHESTRDKLLAITQSFLHLAIETHREGSTNHTPETGLPSLKSASSGTNFILLPPSRVLEYFLRSYANCFERYYPLTSRGTLDANELLHCFNDKAASLLVLSMIAQGAMVEARMLTGGLTEASRISLFDLIEKNVLMASDPLVLHAALLFTVQAAWSGDRMQMNIAMGQRGMYFAMLRHSGALNSKSSLTAAADSRNSFNTDQLWQDWIQDEGRSRLVYSWILVDQELACFHDSAPLFSVNECAAPMPDTDRLWHAKTAAEWCSVFESVHEFSNGFSSLGSGARPSALSDLFRHFLDDEMVSLGIEMTPLQLRLLLHPLQSLCVHLSQLLQCFSEQPRKQNDMRTVTADSTRGRVQEVQSLLQRWFDLAERYLKANHMCAMMQTNLIIFHLISLNAVTNFTEIEKFARREGTDGTYAQLMHIHKRCMFDIEEAVFHCGQVFRLIRQMPRGIRPPWWSAAVYRVALILWFNALSNRDSSTPSNGLYPVPGPSFQVDNVPADHPLLIRYLTKREGVPNLTKRDGSQIGIDHPSLILRHCVSVIDEGAATRFSDGIRAKLETLARS